MECGYEGKGKRKEEEHQGSLTIRTTARTFFRGLFMVAGSDFPKDVSLFAEGVSLTLDCCTPFPIHWETFMPHSYYKIAIMNIYWELPGCIRYIIETT